MVFPSTYRHFASLSPSTGCLPSSHTGEWHLVERMHTRLGTMVCCKITNPVAESKLGGCSHGRPTKSDRGVRSEGEGDRTLSHSPAVLLYVVVQALASRSGQDGALRIHESFSGVFSSFFVGMSELASRQIPCFLSNSLGARNERSSRMPLWMNSAKKT